MAARSGSSQSLGGRAVGNRSNNNDDWDDWGDKKVTAASLWGCQKRCAVAAGFSRVFSGLRTCRLFVCGLGKGLLP